MFGLQLKNSTLWFNKQNNRLWGDEFKQKVGWDDHQTEVTTKTSFILVALWA